MTTLAELLRRVVALLAFATGMLLAAFLAALAFLAAAGIGAAIWLNARFGRRRSPRPRPRESDVIDMTLREVHPEDPRGDRADTRPVSPPSSAAPRQGS